MLINFYFFFSQQGAGHKEPPHAPARDQTLIGGLREGYPTNKLFSFG